MPPSARVPRTWLIITLPSRMAKMEPFARSWIASPDRLRSSLAISGGDSPGVGTQIRRLDRVELDQRHRGHRQLDLKLGAVPLGGDLTEGLEPFETIRFAEARPAGG